MVVGYHHFRNPPYKHGVKHPKLGNEEMIFRVWNDERVIFHDGEEMRR